MLGQEYDMEMLYQEIKEEFGSDDLTEHYGQWQGLELHVYQNKNSVTFHLFNSYCDNIGNLTKSQFLALKNGERLSRYLDRVWTYNLMEVGRF